MNNTGHHVTLDAYFATDLNDADILAICQKAIKFSNMNVICQIQKYFEPHGMTALWLLAESHFSVHTFPENKYISVDCYTCGNEGSPEKAIDYLVENLKPIKSNIQKLIRS